jgi:hypothetical protein
MIAGVIAASHHLKIFWNIIKRIVVFVMNDFLSRQFSTESAFHDDSMLVLPPASVSNFELPVDITAIIRPEPSRSDRHCSRMIHSRKSLAYFPSSRWLIPGFLKAFTTLPWIPKRFAILSSDSINLRTTNSAQLKFQF